MIAPADQELMLAYLEGRLSAAEALAFEARLKADQTLALAYLALAREESVFRRWAALAAEEPAAASNGQPPADLAPRPAPQPARNWRRWTVPLGILAAALLLAIGIHRYAAGPGRDLAVVKPARTTQSGLPDVRQGTADDRKGVPDDRPVLAHLHDIQGQVSLVDAGESIRIQSGRAIRAGQAIQLGSNGSSAEIRYDDGTTLELGPGTSVRLDQEAGKRVFLTSGVLTASVARQPAPMIVSTPHAQIKVLGTRFCSISGAQETQVELEEGKIELTRKSDGRTIEVQPGTFAVATARTEPLAPLPLPARITRERRLFQVGEGPVLSLAVSPDGKRLAAGGWHGIVRVWDPQTGQEVHTLSGHSRKVRALVFTPDGQRLISASEDRSILVWNLKDGSLEKMLPCHRDLEALAVSPDGKLLAAGGWGRAAQEIQVFELPTFQPLYALQRHQNSITSLAFTPNSKFLASGGKDGTAKLWDLANRSELATLTMGSQPVRSVAFSPDGRRLAGGTQDGAIQLWDWVAAELEASWQSRMGTVACVAFSPDGKILASSGGRGSTTLWDLAARSEGPTIHGHSFMVPIIAFAPDGKSLFSGGWDRTVKLWDLTDGMGAAPKVH